MRPRLVPRIDRFSPPNPLNLLNLEPTPVMRFREKSPYVPVTSVNTFTPTPVPVMTDILAPTDISVVSSASGTATSVPEVIDVNLTSSYTPPIPAGVQGNQMWGNFSMGVKAAIIMAGILGIVAIVIASIWFCCGTPRRRRLKAEEDMQLHEQRMAAEAERANEVSTDAVPLRTMSGNHRRDSTAPIQARGAVGSLANRFSRRLSVRGSDAPPRYEEVVPPAHQRLAGGMVRRGGQNHASPEEEDGMGVVADGKTPLSEIPFEDVVQPRGSGSASSSSSNSSEGGRDFGIRHAMGGGNTAGHTNA